MLQCKRFMADHEVESFIAIIIGSYVMYSTGTATNILQRKGRIFSLLFSITLSHFKAKFIAVTINHYQPLHIILGTYIGLTLID